MAQKAETRFKEKVRKDLKNLLLAGGKIWFEKISQQAKRGTPDFLICINGGFWAIELKTDLKGSGPDMMQTHVLAQIKKAQGVATIETPKSWPKALQAITAAAFDFGETN